MALSRPHFDLRFWRVALALGALGAPAAADTVQDFDGPGSAYSLGQHAGTPAASVVGGGPTGNFLRLASGAAASGSLNTLNFDRTDKGAFCTVTIDFDFRITPGNGSADGFGVSFLDTVHYDESGLTAGAEEPDLEGSLGVGFDVFANGVDVNDNHVSVHFDDALVSQQDASPVVDLDDTAGQFVHAQVQISADDVAGDVTVTLTPPGGGPVVLINALAVPGLRPYEGRVHFGARTSSQSADHDFDNISVSYSGCPAVLGEWGEVLPWPILPIHMAMLPNGKVLFYDRDDFLNAPPYLWDPQTEIVTPAADPGPNIFCSGHSLLSNGKLLVTGGQDGGAPRGLNAVHTYDGDSDTWAFIPAPMNAGRWYPTNTTLANGDTLVVSGLIKLGEVNSLPQVFQAASSSWRDLTGADRPLPVDAIYPYMHLAPNGMVFNSGPETTTRYLDTSGTGAWIDVAPTGSIFRTYAGSVMYDEGKLLLTGGGSPPTRTAEVIDLADPSPQWRFVDSMAYRRRQLNSAILADGTILVTGGTKHGGFNDAAGAIYAAELWDPATETWSTLPGAQVTRVYHSVSLLLPDGRVLTGGGGHPDGGPLDIDHLDVEVYSPAYLFKGPRPVIASAPNIIRHGRPFFVGTPDAASIAQVNLIRLSAVTHSFNQTQQINRLAFSVPNSGLLQVTAPANANLAPPGHYMLFIVNGDGVPSVAPILQLIETMPVPALGPWAAVALAGLLGLAALRLVRQ